MSSNMFDSRKKQNVFNLKASQITKNVMLLFHNDLRIYDNATLNKASSLTKHESSINNTRLVPVYASKLLAPKRLENNLKKNQQLNARFSQAYQYAEMGDARKRFLMQTLADLNGELGRLGSQLVYLAKQKDTNSFLLICQLIEDAQISDICVSQTADYNQNQAYQALQEKYPNITWHVSNTSTLFYELPTENLPSMFTEFRKKIEHEHHLLNVNEDLNVLAPPQKLAPLPESLKSSDRLFCRYQQDYNLNFLPTYPKGEFVGGEHHALSHLSDYFNSEAPGTYKTTRNALDQWSHSTKFSAWLANGSLSVNTLLNRLRDYQQQVLSNESTYWIWFELLWREYFYWYAIKYGYKLFIFEGISNKKPLTSFYPERFESWKAGNTAYPIVNACMKQLKQTGYMSNRGRQLVASCFVHELGLDWRYGATYFEQQLLDYDVASNWANWQYLAGVGANPRGSRQFNLEKQTQHYDPNSEFIQKWQGDIDTIHADSIDITGWPIN